LIDCGEGTQIRLRQQRVTLSRIHHIFISHLHGDHVFGLFGLLSSMGMTGRQVPVNLYGPGRLRELMEQYLKYFGPLPYEIRCHAPGKGEGSLIYEDEKITVESIPLKHRTRTYGYLFREKEKPLNLRKEKVEEFQPGIAEMVRIKRGEDFITSDGRMIPNREMTHPPYRRRSYAYLSDTRYDPKLAERVAGVDLLFHEATFAGNDERLAGETLHSTSRQAAELARLAGAGRLLIGHFSTRYKDPSRLVEEAREIFPRTDGVMDGDRYSVPAERVAPE